MTVPERVDDPADARLADFAHLRSPDRRVGIERDRGIFTVEGNLGLRALLASGHTVRSVLVESRRLDELAPLLEDVDAPIYAASVDVIKAMAGFAFHRGVLALAERRPPLAVDDITRGARRLLVTEGVNDFENLGSLYRNAAAFGVDGVVLDPTTAEPLYRRVVRVSMGHVLTVPTARTARDDWPSALATLVTEGFTVLALTPGADAEAIDDVVRAPPVRWALLVGAEGPGLTAGALRAASRCVRIPLAPGVDSLNVATAAAIALHRLT
jgi:tRNA G18 (ribose-2'-O)-methylase SpoU